MAGVLLAGFVVGPVSIVGAAESSGLLAPTADLSIEHVVGDGVCAGGFQADASVTAGDDAGADSPRSDGLSSGPGQLAAEGPGGPDNCPDGAGGSGPPPETPNPNGASNTLQIGGTAYGDPEPGYATRWTTLIDFDLSGVPDGATVTGATLTVEARKKGDVVDAVVAPITSSWDEASVDLPLLSSTGRVPVTISPGVDTSIDVQAAVDEWVASDGHGLGISFADGATPGQVEVYSREKPAFQAQLLVEWVDNPAPPQVTITSPSGGDAVFGDVELVAQATAEAGVHKVEFLVDAALVGTALSSPYTTTWDSALVEDGTRVIEAVVTDTLGATDSDTVTVLLANDDARVRLDQDFQSGHISVDEYVRQALLLVARDPDLAPRYAGEVSDGISSWLFEVLTHLRDVEPATREWAEQYLTPVEEESAPASQQASAAADEPVGISPPTCNRLLRLIKRVTDCHVSIGPVELRWNSNEVDGDTDGNGVPDVVDDYASGFRDAINHYNSLGYPAVDNILAQVVLGDIRAFTVPKIPGFLTPPGLVFIPSEHPAPSALAAHELFHHVQYQYLGVTDYIDILEPRPAEFDKRLERVLWWLEASAEWASHQVMEAFFLSYQGTDDFFEYAERLPEFFGTASSSLADWTRHANRQYGAFVVAEWLDDFAGRDSIRQVWEGVGLGTDPLESMDTLDAFGGLGLGELLSVMWANIYFLDIDPEGGFRDNQATVNEWRNILRTDVPGSNGPPFGEARISAERSLNFQAGQSETWDLSIGGGGVQFIELDAVERGDFAVEVAGDVPLSVSARALTDFNTDPTVGPHGDACAAELSHEAPAGTDPWMVDIRDYDPGQCEGIVISVVNEDWDSRDSTSVAVDVDFGSALGAPITFSEVPLGSAVTDQYDGLGVVFGGDSPFTTNDGSNPTSPVLSGTPLFQGSIAMDFVIPGTITSTTVDAVEFDVGYINDAGGVVVTAYDLSGTVIASATPACCGIQSVQLAQPGIHRVVVDVKDFEAAGAAIDNVAFG